MKIRFEGIVLGIVLMAVAGCGNDYVPYGDGVPGKENLVIGFDFDQGKPVKIRLKVEPKDVTATNVTCGGCVKNGLELRFDLKDIKAAAKREIERAIDDFMPTKTLQISDDQVKIIE